jgi:hypothetical protein
MKILNVEVKTHNEREKILVRIINSNIERCRGYVEENTFGDNTRSVVKRILLETDALFLALFYMELVEVTTIRPDLEKEFGIDLY